MQMALRSIHIDLPADILLTLNESESDLAKRIKLALAIQLYQQQKITIGKATQIAEMSRLKFETYLSEHQIPISNLDAETVLKDLEKLK